MQSRKNSNCTRGSRHQSYRRSEKVERRFFDAILYIGLMQGITQNNQRQDKLENY